METQAPQPYGPGTRIVGVGEYNQGDLAIVLAGGTNRSGAGVLWLRYLACSETQWQDETDAGMCGDWAHEDGASLGDFDPLLNLDLGMIAYAQFAAIGPTLGLETTPKKLRVAQGAWYQETLRRVLEEMLRKQVGP